MDLRVDWQPPIPLALDHSASHPVHKCELDELPDRGGIYVFGRSHGNHFEALYVGKTSRSIRKRVRSHFNNLKLMDHVSDAKNGKRILLIGLFHPGKAQQERVCLPLIERALIRYFMSEAHDLVNVQGARLRQHAILSTGAKRIVPEEILLDRG